MNPQACLQTPFATDQSQWRQRAGKSRLRISPTRPAKTTGRRAVMFCLEAGLLFAVPRGHTQEEECLVLEETWVG
jgi:hypothetical protein